MSSGRTHFRKERVLTFEEAQAIVNEHAELLRRAQRQSEQVALLNSLGRTLAEDIVADRDFPPFPRATRDGYAVRSEDVQTTPADLSLVGQVRAGGDLPSDFTTLQPMQAVSIMTGAPVPAGADAVVMVEYTKRASSRVHILKPVAADENVVARGSEAQSGAVLAQTGLVIRYPDVALAAAIGKSSLSVSKRPRIAILPTGDEIVDVTQRPADNQIRNSNSFSLAAQTMAAGGEPIQLPVAPDEPRRLRELIALGLDSDLLLMSGGVSAGEYDLVEDVLSDFSAEFLFTGVQIQPGKPLVFGRARPHGHAKGWTYFFGLPGNPISTMVTFELFARMVVRALSAASSMPIRGTMARLAKPVKVKAGLTRFLPARLCGQWDNAEVETVKWQGSGDIAAFERADCLLVIPPDRAQLDVGVMVTVIPL